MKNYLTESIVELETKLNAMVYRLNNGLIDSEDLNNLAGDYISLIQAKIDSLKAEKALYDSLDWLFYPVLHYNLKSTT